MQVYPLYLFSFANFVNYMLIKNRNFIDIYIIISTFSTNKPCFENQQYVIKAHNTNRKEIYHTITKCSVGQ